MQPGHPPVVQLTPPESPRTEQTQSAETPEPSQSPGTAVKPIGRHAVGPESTWAVRQSAELDDLQVTSTSNSILHLCGRSLSKSCFNEVELVMYSPVDVKHVTCVSLPSVLHFDILLCLSVCGSVTYDNQECLLCMS